MCTEASNDRGIHERPTTRLQSLCEHAELEAIIQVSLLKSLKINKKRTVSATLSSVALASLNA